MPRFKNAHLYDHFIQIGKKSRCIIYECKYCGKQLSITSSTRLKFHLEACNVFKNTPAFISFQEFDNTKEPSQKTQINNNSAPYENGYNEYISYILNFAIASNVKFQSIVSHHFVSLIKVMKQDFPLEYFTLKYLKEKVLSENHEIIFLRNITELKSSASFTIIIAFENNYIDIILHLISGKLIFITSFPYATDSDFKNLISGISTCITKFSELSQLNGLYFLENRISLINRIQEHFPNVFCFVPLSCILSSFMMDIIKDLDSQTNIYHNASKLIKKLKEKGKLEQVQEDTEEENSFIDVNNLTPEIIIEDEVTFHDYHPEYIINLNNYQKTNAFHEILTLEIFKTGINANGDYDKEGRFWSQIEILSNLFIFLCDNVLKMNRKVIKSSQISLAHITNHICNFISTCEDELIQGVVQRHFERHSEQISHNGYILLSQFLDPYNKTFSLGDKEKDEIRSILFNMCDRNDEKFSIMTREIEEFCQQKESFSTLNVLLDLKVNFDPFTWWQNYTNKPCLLKKIARQLFTLPHNQYMDLIEKLKTAEKARICAIESDLTDNQKDQYLNIYFYLKFCKVNPPPHQSPQPQQQTTLPPVSNQGTNINNFVNINNLSHETNQPAHL